MRKSILLAVVLMAALVAVPASASVQNVKISGDIDNTWLYRNNFDFGDSLNNNVAQTEDLKQSVFISQTRLQVDADLTDQVSATVGLINERHWEQNVGDENTNIDLYLAYVTLREMLYSPLTVVVGRQVFSYGNSFIFDATGANNVAGTDTQLRNVAADLTKQTSLDAIRLIFDYNPLTVEIVYAKGTETTPGFAKDSVTDDIDYYGINSTYELGDDMETQVEAYFFARIDQTPNPGTHGLNVGANKSDTLYIPGLRASANVLDGLNIQGEIAWQRGLNATSTASQVDGDERDAMAAQFITNYQVPSDILPDVLEGYNPVLSYVYTWVTGDSNPLDRGDAQQQASSNKDTAWDPALEAQGGGTIYNAIFNLTNLHIHSISLTANPIEDVTAKVSWHGLWLDKKIDEAATTTTFGLRDPASNNATTYNPTVNKGKTEVGNEIDVEAIYDYTEDVQFGASFGWFLPGNLFEAQNDSVASQAIVHGNVNF